LPDFAYAGLPVRSELVRSELVGSEAVRVNALAEVPLRWTFGPFADGAVLERGCNDMI
jgi:hypothetical protein